jgi:L-type amino acid transporter 9
MAAKSLLGYPAGILISVLVAGASTSILFAVGRLTVAASQRGYLPSFLGVIGLPSWASWPNRRARSEENAPQNPQNDESEPLISGHSDEGSANSAGSNDLDTEWDAPM